MLPRLSTVALGRSAMSDFLPATLGGFAFVSMAACVFAMALAFLE